MVGGWLAKGLLAFLLTFAVVGLAHGQTKSAELPVPQRIICVPDLAIRGDFQVNEMPTWMSPSIASLIQGFTIERFGLQTLNMDNTWPEMGILPWAAKALLDLESNPAVLFAPPIERLIGLFY